MKKIISITLVFFIVLASIVGIIPMNIASAGQDAFIAPLFSGYVEDENKSILLSQNTLIDMSLYNGVGNLGDDVGRVQAISAYAISNSEEGQAFCVPYLGTMDNLNKVEIILNGQAVNVERLYGETPSYFAGDGQGYRTIIEAIESVKPTTLIEGTGKLYTFEPIGGEVEFSFQKNQEQTVVHNGVSWSRQGINGYSFKGKNSDMEEYPYHIFVSKGELTAFQSNIEYSITDITYKDYVNFYLDEWIMELGEEYRPYYYSKFNRNLSGGVFDISDALYDYSAYVFALLKVELPIGISEIVVNSDVYALVNALYKPYIYIVRMVSPYSQKCEYSLDLKLSEKLPYILEDNIGFTEMKYEKNTQILDGYFVVGEEKKVESLLQKNKGKDCIFNYIAFAFLGIGGLVVLIVLGFCIKCRK